MTQGFGVQRDDTCIPQTFPMLADRTASGVITNCISSIPILSDLYFLFWKAPVLFPMPRQLSTFAVACPLTHKYSISWSQVQNQSAFDAISILCVPKQSPT